MDTCTCQIQGDTIVHCAFCKENERIAKSAKDVKRSKHAFLDFRTAQPQAEWQTQYDAYMTAERAFWTAI